jgi:hypothetical protein
MSVSGYVFDTLKSPRGLGMHEGQRIHVKDMNQIQGGQPKPTRSLLKGASSQQPINVGLSLEVAHNTREYVFNIGQPDPVLIPPL